MVYNKDKVLKLAKLYKLKIYNKNRFYSPSIFLDLLFPYSDIYFQYKVVSGIILYRVFNHFVHCAVHPAVLAIVNITVNIQEETHEA